MIYCKSLHGLNLLNSAGGSDWTGRNSIHGPSGALLDRFKETTLSFLLLIDVYPLPERSGILLVVK